MPKFYVSRMERVQVYATIEADDKEGAIEKFDEHYPGLTGFVGNGGANKLVGISPSKCSRRDLIADLAKALKSQNIRLLVYLPSGAPAADHEARKRLGWRWGRPGGWQLPGEAVGGLCKLSHKDGRQVTVNVEYNQAPPPRAPPPPPAARLR